MTTGQNIAMLPHRRPPVPVAPTIPQSRTFRVLPVAPPAPPTPTPAPPPAPARPISTPPVQTIVTAPPPRASPAIPPPQFVQTLRDYMLFALPELSHTPSALTPALYCNVRFDTYLAQGTESRTLLPLHQMARDPLPREPIVGISVFPFNISRSICPEVARAGSVFLSLTSNMWAGRIVFELFARDREHYIKLKPAHDQMEHAQAMHCVSSPEIYAQLSARDPLAPHCEKIIAIPPHRASIFRLPNMFESCYRIRNGAQIIVPHDTGPPHITTVRECARTTRDTYVFQADIRAPREEADTINVIFPENGISFTLRIWFEAHTRALW